MCDHRVAKLRTVNLKVNLGKADSEPEQVPYGVGAALALAPTTHHELALCTDRGRERLEWRLELAQIRGGRVWILADSWILARGRKTPE
jgi:hypothetical protein